MFPNKIPDELQKTTAEQQQDIVGVRQDSLMDRLQLMAAQAGAAVLPPCKCCIGAGSKMVAHVVKTAIVK